MENPSHGYLQKTVGRHPVATAVAMGVLVVVILVLAYFLVHYRAQCSAAGQASQASHFMPGAAGARGYPGCAPGETPVTYQATDGSSATYCRSTDAMPGPAAVCGRGWDPAASAEAQALATVGSLEHRPFAESRLRRAVDAAYDSSEGMTDEQLTTLMHEGGAP